MPQPKVAIAAVFVLYGRLWPFEFNQVALLARQELDLELRGVEIVIQWVESILETLHIALWKDLASWVPTLGAMAGLEYKEGLNTRRSTSSRAATLESVHPRTCLSGTSAMSLTFARRMSICCLWDLMSNSSCSLMHQTE